MKKLIHIMMISMILACQPEPLIVDDVPEADQKMVVSSVVTSQSIITLFLTKSFGALDGDISTDSEILDRYVIDNAVVSIESKEGVDFLERIGLGLYASNDMLLIPQDTYKLEVNDANSGLSVTSVTVMGERAIFDKIEVEMETESIDTIAIVKYGFQDFPGESYYMINVQQASQQFQTPEEILDNRVYTYLISDEEFGDGAYIEGEFFALFRETSFRDTMLVSLSNISFEYYQYLDEVNNGFLGPSLITEPYNYSSNIEGGYGFFNLYFKDNRILVLE